jgi:hypothetical protein
MNEFTEVAAATPLMKGIPSETKEGSSILVSFAAAVDIVIRFISPEKPLFE